MQQACVGCIGAGEQDRSPADGQHVHAASLPAAAKGYSTTVAADRPQRDQPHRHQPDQHQPNQHQHPPNQHPPNRVTIDLNADVGEGFGPWRMGDDAAMLEVVTSANIACGFHAGDPQTMRRTIDAALSKGVAIGAHVAYPDLRGFGRRETGLPTADVVDDIAYQLGALTAVARVAGATVRHVKPHGALYHRLSSDAELAQALVAAVQSVDPELVLVAAPGAVALAAAAAAGLAAVAEGFADRGYQADGRLVSRGEAEGVLDNADAVAQRAVRMVTQGGVTAVDGSWVPLPVATLCVHGDSPGAVGMATAVRAALHEAGIALAPVRTGEGLPA